MSTAVTDQTFDKEVLQSNGLVIVDFWAPWCAPCLMLGPMIEDLGKKFSSVKVLKLNVDENPQTAMMYGINAIPTVMVFEDGKLKERLIGVQPVDNYIKALGLDNEKEDE